MDGAEVMALERAQDGDREAFRMLVERYSHEMFRLAYRMTGNEADAEDVVQETFLRAFRRIGRFDSRARFSSWLYAIASNHAIDLLRRRKRWRSTGVEPTERQAPLVSDRPDPERTAYGGELLEKVGEAMGALSPRERVAFTLRHHEGMSIREIGRVMGLRQSATKNHIFRAVRKLRARLGPLAGASR
jgi:RNA polymerase sigma-70 factor (ECF subfamily)